MNPTDPKTTSNPEFIEIEPGSPIFSVTLWECTPRLRWTAAPDYSTGAVFEDRAGDRYRLQQLWTCRQTGATEWRDVPVEND